MLNFQSCTLKLTILYCSQVHDKYDKSKHSTRKRNLAITGAVSLSIVVSPLLAALTVGVGVPIALGYIYGVVPISLCRGGGCASVTATRNGRGVNLEFDEDAEAGMPGQPSVAFASSRSSSRSSTRSVDKPTAGKVTVVATVNQHSTGMCDTCHSSFLGML